MEKFNLKNHNEKMMTFSKNVINGTYPSKKIAKTGSFIGLIIGGLLIVIGCVSFFWSGLWWLGSLLAGSATVISNIFNLKRISKYK